MQTLQGMSCSCKRLVLGSCMRLLDVTDRQLIVHPAYHVYGPPVIHAYIHESVAAVI